MKDEATTEKTCHRDRLFETEIRHHQGLVYSVVFAIIADSEETLDVLQETFVKAFSEPRFLDEGFERKGWLVRVARNLALNARRSFLRRIRNFLKIRTHVPTEFIPEYAEFMIREESRSNLRNALEKLTLEEREMVALRFGADFSYKQIATELEIPIGTVMSRLSRVKEKLGIALPEEFEK